MPRAAITRLAASCGLLEWSVSKWGHHTPALSALLCWLSYRLVCEHGALRFVCWQLLAGRRDFACGSARVEQIIHSVEVQVLLLHRFKAKISLQKQTGIRGQCDKTGALLRLAGCRDATSGVQHCDKTGTEPALRQNGCHGQSRTFKRSCRRDRGQKAHRISLKSTAAAGSRGWHCDMRGASGTRHEVSACRNVQP